MAILASQFEINGVIDTRNNVMDNINKLCTASNCWMTYDFNAGMWSVVINNLGTSVKSFDDSNILGNINLSGSGIDELYNAVTVDFPHKDLRDQIDYVDLKIPDNVRYPNELDNELAISLELVNNPVQAQLIGTIELKQSRVDTIVEFRSDFTALGLKAGDLIDITSAMYGYSNKMFRIIKLSEDDADDGTIQVSITALEYDPAVYDTSGLVRTERNKKTGITPKSSNTAITNHEAQVAGKQAVNGMDNLALAALLLKLMGLPSWSNATGSQYTLPPASSTSLGGIKLGEGLEISSDGKLSLSSRALACLSTCQGTTIETGECNIHSTVNMVASVDAVITPPGTDSRTMLYVYFEYDDPQNQSQLVPMMHMTSPNPLLESFQQGNDPNPFIGRDDAGINHVAGGTSEPTVGDPGIFTQDMLTKCQYEDTKTPGYFRSWHFSTDITGVIEGIQYYGWSPQLVFDLHARWDVWDQWIAGQNIIIRTVLYKGCDTSAYKKTNPISGLVTPLVYSSATTLTNSTITSVSTTHPAWISTQYGWMRPDPIPMTAYGEKVATLTFNAVTEAYTFALV